MTDSVSNFLFCVILTLFYFENYRKVIIQQTCITGNKLKNRMQRAYAAHFDIVRDEIYLFDLSNNCDNYANNCDIITTA